VPFVVETTWPVVSVPLTAGSAVFDGGVVVDGEGLVDEVLAAIASAADVARAVPFLFFAITVTRVAPSASLATIRCVARVSPGIGAHTRPATSQRLHS
jgi:hypothetical protein